ARPLGSGPRRAGKSSGLSVLRVLARSWERNARIRALGSQPPPSGSWVARGPDKRYAESGSPFCDSLLGTNKYQTSPSPILLPRRIDYRTRRRDAPDITRRSAPVDAGARRGNDVTQH